MSKPLIIALSAALALGAGAQAMSNALTQKSPALAIALSPVASQPHERLASRSLTADEDTQQLVVTDAVPHARAALDNALLATEALAVLALAEDDPRTAAAMMEAAMGASRRGRILNSAMLVSAAGRQDTDHLLATLNRSLVLYPSQEDTIVPLMVDQLGDARMVPAFIQLLEGSPLWAEEFWLQAGTRPDDAENIAAIRLGLPRSTVVPREANKAVLRVLARGRQYAEAAQVYARISNLDEVVPAQGRLGWASEYTPLEWQFFDVNGRFARPLSDGNSVAINIRGGYGGLLARRLIRLDGGSVFFEVNHSLDPASASRLRLTLECPGTDNRWSSPLGGSPTGLRVDRDMPCDYAWLGIVGRSSTGSSAISGELLGISIM